MFDIDDVLDIDAADMNEELKKGIRTNALPLTHLSHMHWTSCESRAADNINGNLIDLSSPPTMGGSTGICIANPVGQPHLVVHGGIRYVRERRENISESRALVVPSIVKSILLATQSILLACTFIHCHLCSRRVCGHLCSPRLCVSQVPAQRRVPRVL